MKIQKILLTLLSLLSLIIAQDTWVKTYQPFGDGDYFVEDVLVCADSGYAVNGYYYCYDPEPGTGCDDYWGFLMKTDSDGNLEWIKMDTVSWIEESESSAFVQTDDGGFISAVFSLWGGTALIKRDSLGNREWVVDNGSVENGLYIHSMDMTLDSNIILGGRMNGQATFRKITQTGETLWTHSYFPQSGSIQSIIQTSDGGYAGTGYINLTSLDILVVKTDENGDSLWTRTFDGYLHNDIGLSLTENFNQELCIVGGLRNPTINRSFGLVWLLDSLGNTQWNQIRDDIEGSGHGCVIHLPDSSFVTSASQMDDYKFDYNYNIIWESSIVGGGGGDKKIGVTNNYNFILIGIYQEGYQDYISLTKTNSEYQLALKDEAVYLPNKLYLSSYPNPFNKTVNILLAIPHPMKIVLSIFSVNGQLVNTIKEVHLLKGHYSFNWDGINIQGTMVSSGVYIAVVYTEHQLFDSQKITLLK